jgi:hypothetical protein
LIVDEYDLSKTLVSNYFGIPLSRLVSNGDQIALVAGSNIHTIEITGIHLERVSMNEVRLWNRTGTTLEMMLSVNQ